MTNIVSVGYMIQDKQGTAIFGVGSSVDEAWAMVINEVRTFSDAYGNDISPNDAFRKDFKAYGATQALLDKVNSYGGDISWEVIDGVACTLEESNSHNGV